MAKEVEPLGLLAESHQPGDRRFYMSTKVLAGIAVGTLVALVVLVIVYSWPALAKYGLAFVTTSTWDPVFLVFGGAHFVYGTLITSAIALLIACPIGIGAAVFVAEYAPEWLREPVSFATELLAVIPSIIYGLWGFMVLGPLMRTTIEPALQGSIGAIPIVGMLFAGPPLGRDMLTGGTILSVMILPTIMAIAREVLRAVPDTQREGMLALGATKWETISHAVLPYARLGLIGAAGLGLARALGETMAVTMVIGNSSTAITPSLFNPGYTLASAIANQFTEADSDLYFSAVVALALALLLVSLGINVLSRLLVKRMTTVGEEGMV